MFAKSRSLENTAFVVIFFYDMFKNANTIFCSLFLFSFLTLLLNIIRWWNVAHYE